MILFESLFGQTFELEKFWIFFREIEGNIEWLEEEMYVFEYFWADFPDRLMELVFKKDIILFE